MKKVLLNTSVILLCGFYISGCSSIPIVQPTGEELEASKMFKKTVAIVEFTDEGSPIKDMQAVALPELEKYLIRHFNLVEREKINSVISERRFSNFNDVERINELGKLLGADYLVFGNVIASVSEPKIKYQDHEYDNGKFYGSIWQESYATSEISLKFVNVSNGMVVYADKQSSRRMIKDKEEFFHNKTLFTHYLSINQAVKGITEIIGVFKDLHKEYAFGLSQSLESSIRKFNRDLNYKFPQTGQIMDVVSDKQVLVNLGSAYGIKPGDKLIVWNKKPSFRDPKTGLVTIPREKKAILKVIQVTSGLACIAKGSTKDISSIRIGDAVQTYQ